MKIELYLVPKDKEGKLLKKFLEINRISFKEIIINDINILENVARTKLSRKKSLLKITYNSGIGVITGFNEYALNQLLEHIKKYKPNVES